jgi:hypothetical protein
MTNVCYTLEEVAEKLKFSETVLVRLSQYLKMPRAAYEASGYLSFKGDLTFSEQDLDFFTQVKERLLLGESLDDVKNRLPQVVNSSVESNETTNPIKTSEGREGIHSAPEPLQVQPSVSPSAAMIEALDQEPDVLGGTASTAPGELPPMREIQDREPYEKAAEKSFERYKSRHRSGIGKVFENMLKEVGGPQAGRRSGSLMPTFKPMRGKSVENLENPPETSPRAKDVEDAALPFSRWLGSSLNNNPGTNLGGAVGPGFTQPAGIREPREKDSKDPVERFVTPPKSTQPVVPQAIWEPLVQQAAQKPRALSIQLKNAALLLREQTLGHSANLSNSSQDQR